MKSKEELTDLLLYKQWVEDMALTNSTDIEWNSDSEHAMIVLENIFKFAKKKINIIAENFDDRVCTDSRSNYISSLKSFLLGGGEINVLLTDNKLSKTNKILGVLSQYALHKDHKDKICVKVASEPILDENGEEFNLTTADESIIRYEYDPKRFAAKFSFNRPNLVNIYNNTFNKFFNNPNNQLVNLNDFLPTV
jgi:hypothetical protein